jgi:hypothetical protein
MEVRNKIHGPAALTPQAAVSRYLTKRFEDSTANANTNFPKPTGNPSRILPLTRQYSQFSLRKKFLVFKEPHTTAHSLSLPGSK